MRCFLKSLDIAHSAVDALEEIKGEDIILMDLTHLNTFTDYFVIGSGTSHRMLNALMTNVKRAVKTDHQKNIKVEGEPMDGWMLADYGGVVVHLFSKDARENYDLEGFWEEAKVILTLV